MARLNMLILICLCLSVWAQPPPGGNNGNSGSSEDGAPGDSSSSSSDACPDYSSCVEDGSTAYSNLGGLTFDTSTFKFTGEMIVNQCPVAGVTFMITPSPSCTAVNLPDTSTVPAAAALIGAVGYTLSGTNIYGPYEAGFQSGMACESGSTGDCDGGVDVPTCFYELQKECENNEVNEAMFEDFCGGHADPYHLHMHAACEYDACTWDSHSAAIGVALDGGVIYGMWESDGKMPQLDACNGHYGTVPETSHTDSEGNVVVIPATDNVYHYHMSALDEPFTIGCFGPVDSVEECKALYDGCSDATVEIDVMLNDGTEASVDYTYNCPCWDNNYDLWDDTLDWLTSHCDGNFPSNFGYADESSDTETELTDTEVTETEATETTEAVTEDGGDDDTGDNTDGDNTDGDNNTDTGDDDDSSMGFALFALLSSIAALY